MSLVVDASVALKWFIHEDQREDALALIDLQVPLIVPDLFRSEFTNILWKKVRRQEISQSAAEVLSERIDSFVTQVAVDEGVARQALRYGIALDHPTYDLIYLALAERLGSKFVTADRKFAGKLRDGGLSHLVMLLGELPQARHLTVSDDDTRAVQALHAQFEKTLTALLEQLRAGKPRFHGIDTRELAPAFDSPAYRRMIDALKALPASELLDLAALGWLGCGYDGSDFAALRNHAHAALGDDPYRHIPYISSLLQYLDQGFTRLREQSGTTD